MIQRKFLSNTTKSLILMLGMIVLWSSCGDKKESNENLQKAFEIHKEAISTHKLALDQMAKLKANKDTLFVETYSNDLNAISGSLEEWNKQLVEVPGFDDDNDHSHHDHSDHEHEHDEHHHNGQQELTPEQHLEVQQQLLAEIQAIAAKIKKIKK
ncbi:MAG: hypothetical protein AAGC45_00895 [Bacteroidota bacterium]